MTENKNIGLKTLNKFKESLRQSSFRLFTRAIIEDINVSFIPW